MVAERSNGALAESAKAPSLPEIETVAPEDLGHVSASSDDEESLPSNGRPPPSPFSPEAAKRDFARRLSRITRSLSLELLPQEGEDGVSKESLVPQHTLLSALGARLKETLLLARLAAQLYSYVAGGTMWAVNFWRLVLFALILMPGFLQMVVFYFFAPRMLRSVPYGVESRNVMDIYVPRKKWRRKGPRPVVIFITGGAWIIGYKGWGALLGRRLSQRGVLVACLDYRNFPQGALPDMLEDVNRGISWVLNNAALYGGDCHRVYLVGQSAGAQLGALAIFSQVQQQVEGGEVLGGQPAWDPSKIQGFVGVSGPYNMYALADHLDKRGLYKNIICRLMSVDGRVLMKELSPTYVTRRMSKAVTGRIPPVLLMHGTADKTVPMEIAVEYVTALKESGVPSAKLKLYRDKTHTQPIVEDPMRGGQDELMDDVLSLVTGKEERHSQFPMVPSILIDLASWVCPF